MTTPQEKRDGVEEKVEELLLTLRYCFDEDQQFDEVTAGNQLRTTLHTVAENARREVVSRVCEQGGKKACIRVFGERNLKKMLSPTPQVQEGNEDGV